MVSSFSLELGAQTLHGVFSCELPAALTVDPGDSVRLRTLDAWWSGGPYTGGPIDDRPRVAEHRDGYGHALSGPIAVRGARPGLVLSIRVDALVPDSWGTSATPVDTLNARYGIASPGAVHAWQLDTATMTGRNQHGHTVRLRPFLGVLGMPPPEPGLHPTFPPRWHGGNLDCKELVAGSTL
ncbi:MAG: acetamidase/formamidase family protein, partial [Mycobacterium sp.]|nr:acetamidase/formamidase family protein [Mycobacterium sp.]